MCNKNIMKRFTFLIQLALLVLFFNLSKPLSATIITLSPNDGDWINPDDFFISFLIPQQTLQIKKVKLFFDDEDISDHKSHEPHTP